MNRFRRTMIMIAIAVGLLLLPLIAQGQPDQPPDLTIETPVTVNIRAAMPGEANFSGRAGDHVIFAARAQNDADDNDEVEFDTVIRVIAPDDTQLAYADDEPTAVRVRLPQDGDYRVLVDSFNGVSEGTVEIVVQAVDAASALRDADTGDPIDSDTLLPDVTTATGTFTGDAPPYLHTWEMTLAADDRLTITVVDQSGTLDPVMRLQSAAGETLAFNDDHASGDVRFNVFDARVADFVVPSDGRYRVQVWDFVGAAGTFQLEICRNTQTCP